MRAVVQRVSAARVSVENHVVGEIASAIRPPADEIHENPDGLDADGG